MTSTTIVQCPKCFAGNVSAASSCHNCGERLRVAARGTAVSGQVKLADEHVHDAHILDTALAAERTRDAKKVRFWLTIAAVLYLLRVGLVPIIGAFAKPETFAPLFGPHVTPVHYVCLVVFGFCALWSRREPLSAALTAGVLFLFAAVPGIVENPTISGGAVLGKLLMIAVVGRAVSAALMYRIHSGRPELTPDGPKPVTRTSPSSASSDQLAA